ncbi:MAG: hypothetical protein CBB97_01680 [Candidatus Endolissoclinum sp. TMED37]|nr:MAG: hypothetical protein CBB97_01680 [Candidatus Endolissoclinum sp. TMED37]|tara:strand:- start:573 stop:806 length:234 start_codon:yes stop_codon:yes gene_type:complete
MKNFKIMYKGKVIDVSLLTEKISQEDFIEMISHFGFPEWGTPGFYRAIELELVEPEYEYDEIAYHYTHMERDPKSLH